LRGLTGREGNSGTESISVIDLSIESSPVATGSVFVTKTDVVSGKGITVATVTTTTTPSMMPSKEGKQVYVVMGEKEAMSKR